MIGRLIFAWALLGLATAWLRAEETPAADPKPEPGFEQLYQEWRMAGQRLQQLATRYFNSNENERAKIRAEYSTALDASNEEVARLIPAIEQAYKDHKTPAISDMILNIASLSLKGDRFDYALQLATLLSQDLPDNPQVCSILGQSAYELANYDEAQSYLEKAQSLSGLSDEDRQHIRRLLARIPARREILNQEHARLAPETQADDLPRIQFTTTRGNVVIELFEDDFPNTTASLINLVQDGFFDGQEFFRVVPGFAALAGSPTNDGQGGPGYETRREESARGKRPHLRGYFSLIPTTSLTNGSQFLIVLRPSNCESLDSKQDVVGRVDSGVEVVERLRRLESHGSESLFDADRILKAEVVRKRDHRYLAVTTRDQAHEKYSLGLQAFAEQKFPEAEALFLAAQEYLPNNASLHFNLAAAQWNQKKREEAEKHFRQTIRIDPKHARAHHFLGIALLSRNKKEDAAKELREALRLDPSLAVARQLLRQILDEDKNLKAAAPAP